MPNENNMASQTHPLLETLTRAASDIDKLKDSFYPQGLKLNKVYQSKNALRKKDFIALRSSVKKLLKSVEYHVKSKAPSQMKPGYGFLRMVRLDDKLASFIGTKGKGLENVYRDDLLTSHFTNYFYANNLKNGAYIVPNKPLIDLFKEDLLEWKVIDNRGDVLEGYHVRKKDGSRVPHKGFKFIHLQKLLKRHILTDESGKRLVVPRQGHQKFIDVLEKEEHKINDVKDARKVLEDNIQKLEKHKQNEKRAQELNDTELFTEELKRLEKEVKKKQKEFNNLAEKYGLVYE